MDRETAYLVLNLVPGIGPLRLRQLLAAFDTPERVLETPQRALAEVPGMGQKLAELVSHWHDHVDLEKERQLIERGGVRIVTLEDPHYPPLLREIHDPPLCLYVRGDPAVLDRTRGSVAIVGSRRTTRYGVRMAENLARAAAFAGCPVVSGLARGIDTVAHQTVVDAGGCTIAVLGSGLGRIYPQENVELARAIVEQDGVLVSEFPMFYRPDKRSFPMRNRIISGMTRGTIVVEAGHRSGSLITATLAAEQGRQVFAVPGPADAPQSRGCNALIREGASLIETFEDVLADFSPDIEPGGSPFGERAAKAHGEIPPVRALDLNLSELELRILTFLDDGECTIDALIASLGEPASAVLSTLMALEIRHLVRQLPGRRVVKSGPEVIA